MNTTFESKTLTITNLSGSDSGVYVVWAHLNSERRVALDVMSLSINGWDNDIIAEEGKPLNLNCKSGYLTQIFSGAYLVWMLNETVIFCLRDFTSLLKNIPLLKYHVDSYLGTYQALVLWQSHCF